MLKQKSQIIFNIEKRLKDMFEDICKEKGMTKSKLLNMIIQKYVYEYNHKNKERILD